VGRGPPDPPLSSALEVDGPMDPSPRLADQPISPTNPARHRPCALTRAPLSSCVDQPRDLTRCRAQPTVTVLLNHFMFRVSHFGTMLSHFATMLSLFCYNTQPFCYSIKSFSYGAQSFFYFCQSFCYSTQSFCDFLRHFVIFVIHS
jgi:hypothetical protein